MQPPSPPLVLVLTRGEVPHGMILYIKSPSVRGPAPSCHRIVLFFFFRVYFRRQQSFIDQYSLESCNRLRECPPSIHTRPAKCGRRVGCKGTEYDEGVRKKASVIGLTLVITRGPSCMGHLLIYCFLFSCMYVHTTPARLDQPGLIHHPRRATTRDVGVIVE